MRLVRRKPRRPDSLEKLQLEKVIGLTTANANGLACNPTTGDTAYVAGSVVVIYNASSNRQTRFLMASRTPKGLTCVTYSHQGGKLIAAGESGHQPAIIIWDASSGSCLADLKAHKYGISAIQFSPNGKHIVSVGFAHDGLVCLWDFRSGMLVAKVKATSASLPISGIHFASDGSFFITAGASHLKYWTIGLPAGRQRAGLGMGSLTMDGRNVNLGSLRESSFVSVTSTEETRDRMNEIHPIYALTNTGILCVLHRGLAVKKWVNLKVRQGYGLAISGSRIACACSDGIVRIFMLDTLAFAATLPHPAPVGFHDLTDANTCAYLATHNVNGITYPDAVACRFVTQERLAVVYADHSFFIWDVQSFSKVERCQVFLSHSACIWDVTNLPAHQKSTGTTLTSDSTQVGRSVDGQGAFATCSADGSIRLWSIKSQCGEENHIGQSEGLSVTPGNAYDVNMIGVLYTDKQAESAGKAVVADSDEAVESCKGFRAISVSADGHYLAAGDRSGNLHIYDLRSFQIVSFQEAHDAEILTLSFGSVAVIVADNHVKEMLLLVSGGRDRLVHIYDASRNFDVIETLDDHSASITAAKFACNGSKLLSCSADKSVVFRNIEATSAGVKSIRYHQEMACRGTVYDMDVDPSNKLAVTVGQDKKLNLLNLASGKSVRCFKPEGEAGEPIKVQVDPSGTYIVCSHSDKSMRIYDFSNGDLLSMGQGHAEVITGVAFMPDCKRLISVSGDSCIFVWKLPSILTKMMRKRCILQSESQTLHACLQLLESKGHQDQVQNTAINRNSISAKEGDTAIKVSSTTPQLASSVTPAFKFSVSRLPHWAQAKVSDIVVEKGQHKLDQLALYSSESRWVERLGPEGYKLFTEPQMITPPATIHPCKSGLQRRLTIEGASIDMSDTPESSVESQPSGTSAPSSKASERKDTHWKTVHTLFFDEDDYFQDDTPPKGWQLMLADNEEKTHEAELAFFQEHARDLQKVKGEQEPHDGSNDSVIYCSDGEPESTIALDSLPTEKCNDVTSSDKEIGAHLPISVPLVHIIKNGDGDVERRGQEEQIMVPPGDDSTDDDDDNEQYISPDRGLFSAHFGKLSTAIKVHTGQASTRSSFSTRFFARASHPMPIVSLFQDSPAMNMTQTMDRTLRTEVVTCAEFQEQKSLRLREQCLQGQHAYLGTPTEDRPSCSKQLMAGENIDKSSNDNKQQLKSPFMGTVSSQLAVEDFLKSQQNNSTNGMNVSLVSESHFQRLEEDCILCDAENQGHTNVLGVVDCKKSPFNCANQLNKCFTPRATPQGVGEMSRSQTSSAKLNMQSMCSIEWNRCEADAALLPIEKVEVESDLTDHSRTASEKKSELFISDIQSDFPDWHCDALVVPEDKVGKCVSIQTSEGLSKDLSMEKSLISLKPPNPVDRYKNALQELSEAADKALNVFRGLEAMNSADVDGLVQNLPSLYHEFIPPTLQKIWTLSDCMITSRQLDSAQSCDISPIMEYTDNSTLDRASLRSSVPGIQSWPSTSASLAPTSSMLESVDIEGFIQRYSARFSATLASQVLALVQKGLGDQSQ